MLQPVLLARKVRRPQIVSRHIPPSDMLIGRTTTNDSLHSPATRCPHARLIILSSDAFQIVVARREIKVATTSLNELDGKDDEWNTCEMQLPLKTERVGILSFCQFVPSLMSTVPFEVSEASTKPCQWRSRYWADRKSTRLNSSHLGI